MIIQNETETSVVRKLEEIASREETKADRFLANALKLANVEGRDGLLYSEQAEYEVLYERSEVLNDALNEIKQRI
tara:strand:- start:197 stop:421 length:225 start_codon:yes stop_codon:yes gene_type:complete